MASQILSHFPSGMPFLSVTLQWYRIYRHLPFLQRKIRSEEQTASFVWHFLLLRGPSLAWGSLSPCQFLGSDGPLLPGRKEPSGGLPARWRLCLLPSPWGHWVGCEVVGFRARRTGFELQFCPLREVMLWWVMQSCRAQCFLCIKWSNNTFLGCLRIETPKWPKALGLTHR